MSERIVGRYELCGPIAAGGMATVHLGRLRGEAGFSRIVAIKQLHAHFASDPDFAAMFLDEAKLAGRITHPNVVPTLDVVSTHGELLLVMEYVHGESLARLVRAVQARGETVPQRVVCAIVASMLHGLHAAHEAKSERGEPLSIVHRDVSPQNVLVGVDGVARVLDFGVAKARGRVHTTRDGQLKGKIAYMAPEQVAGTGVSRRTDIYAAAVVLWEVLTGARLFHADSEVEVFRKVLEGSTAAPSAVRPGIPSELDAITVRGLSPRPDDRFETAEQMAMALEACGFAPPSEVSAWVKDIAKEAIAERAERIAEIESSSSIEAPQLMSDPNMNTQVTLTAAPSPPPSSRARATSPLKHDGEGTEGALSVASDVRGGSRARQWLVTAAVLVCAASFGGVLALRGTQRDTTPNAGSAAPSGATEALLDSSSAIATSSATPPVTVPEPTSAVPSAVSTATVRGRGPQPSASIKRPPTVPSWRVDPDGLSDRK